MAFTRPSLRTIINRIESDIEQRLTGSTPLLQVAFLRILARVFAGAIHVLYGWLAWLADQLFYDTAEDAMLDRHAGLRGLARKAASFASGSIDMTGTNGTVVEEGTRFTDGNGVELESTVVGTIAGGVLTVAGQAVLPGTAGNLAAATPLELAEPITGVGSAEVASGGFTGGQNEETDNELKLRIGARISTPPAGGTKADFEQWAKAVEGVANAWAFGNNPTPGWVTVVVKASGSNPVPSGTWNPATKTGTGLLGDVGAYIVTLMPVTTNLDVVPIDDEDIDITIDITLGAGADQTDTEAAITANLQSFFADSAEPGENVLISGIRSAVSTTGVYDYSITAISKDSVPQSIDDISMSGFEYAILDAITYT
jgi:uncharacterized phage protein gp47/JayE